MQLFNMNAFKQKSKNSRPGGFNRHSGPSKFGNNAPNNNRRSKKKAESTLDPSLLIRKAIPKEETVYNPSRTFEQMPLDNRLKANIRKKGFKNPTEIQDQTLEHLLAGHDLLGIAQTGTGKTGAFLIPIINRLLTDGRRFQSLVVVPTRELALQVEGEFKSLTAGLGMYSSTFIGGTSINRDMQTLRRPSHLVVGTPGRLLDLANRRALDLSKFSVLVLDEFDRMLDMGFAPDVKRITTAMVAREQTLLFSATIDRDQQKLISELLREPRKEIKVSTGEATGDHIEQDIIRLTPGEDKFQVLRNLVDQEDFDKVLVFAETKHLVSRICEKLQKTGITADQIHGNKSQATRQKALEKFKKGIVQVLVATDVAARGLDISDVTHVINYQLPKTFDSYLHRIGRTGRAGKAGKAFTFVD